MKSKRVFATLLLGVSICCTKAIASVDDFQVERLGRKVVAIKKTTPVEMSVEGDELDLFCERIESYSKQYLDDYNEFGCTEINRYNEVVCKMITEGLARNSSGLNAFGTNLPTEVSVLFSGAQKVTSEDQEEIARFYGVNSEDVELVDQYAVFDISNPTAVLRKSGLFSEMMKVTGIKPGFKLDHSKLSSFGQAYGKTSERYFACALHAGEYEIRLNAQSSIDVEERIESTLLHKLWTTFRKVQSSWKEINPDVEKDDLGVTLVQLGAKMYEIEKKIENSKDDPRLKMEHWMRNFFTKIYTDDAFFYELTPFSGMFDLEEKIYPPKKYEVNLQKIYQAGVSNEE